MIINRTILELSHLCDNMNYTGVWDMLEDLKQIKTDLEWWKAGVPSHPSNEIEKEIDDVDEQLEYLNANIKILNKALIHHEVYLFEDVLISGKASTISLN